MGATLHPDHELVVSIEAGALVGRCRCGQFSYAMAAPSTERLDEFHDIHVKEATR